MRRKLLTLVLCMAGLSMQAQSQLVVKTTGGSTEKFALEQAPTVEFSVTYGETWVTVGDKVQKLDIESLHLENIPADSNLKVLIDVDGTMVLVPIAELKSIVAASYQDVNHLSKAIASNPAVSIYNEALKATHMTDSLMRYMDVRYEIVNKQDSCYWNNNVLCIPVAKDLNGAGGEYDNVAFPLARYYKYTALLVPDAVLKEKYGITSLDGLRKKAHELYDPMYPSDVNVTDETDRRNALNRFISYHLLPFYGEYYKLTAFDGGRLQYNFNREKSDICDWYETMMPHSIMKFSFPSGSDEGLYVNRRGVQSRADDRGVFVRGAQVTPNMEGNIAENGIYHYIDDIVAYGQEMQQVVCNDRMRLDCTTLSPDFMTSGARGHSTRVAEEDGKYGKFVNSNNASLNPNTCLAFKQGFVENIETPTTVIETEYGNIVYGGRTHIHVRNRYLQAWSYQGDAVIIKRGMFDVKVKLPSLPAGKYELRMGTVVGFESNGHLNLYIDDELKGENVDFRPGGNNPISPYNYKQEQTYVSGKRVTRYFLYQDNVWIDEAILDNIERTRLIKDSSGWGISASWREFAKAEYELESEKEVEELFKEQIIDELFRKNDRNNYRNVIRYWNLAQKTPDQYVFEGAEPIDPYDERMDTYYKNLIDWTAFFKLGPVKYFDKILHDKGWMRGAGDYSPGDRNAFDAESYTMRTIDNTRRRVIGTFETDGKTDHYLRLQQQDPSELQELPFDFIELIPVSLIENENIY